MGQGGNTATVMEMPEGAPDGARRLPAAPERPRPLRGRPFSRNELYSAIRAGRLRPWALCAPAHPLDDKGRPLPYVVNRPSGPIRTPFLHLLTRPPDKGKSLPWRWVELRPGHFLWLLNELQLGMWRTGTNVEIRPQGPKLKGRLCDCGFTSKALRATTRNTDFNRHLKGNPTHRELHNGSDGTSPRCQ